MWSKLMKLDESVIGHIIVRATAYGGGFENLEDVDEFMRFLEKLDLVVKPGDSSQSILYENK